MSLQDRFKGLEPDLLRPRCQTCHIVSSMTESDRKAFEAALASDLTTTQIHRVLEDEGFAIRLPGLRRHRKKECLGYEPNETA